MGLLLRGAEMCSEPRAQVVSLTLVGVDNGAVATTTLRSKMDEHGMQRVAFLRPRGYDGVDLKLVRSQRGQHHLDGPHATKLRTMFSTSRRISARWSGCIRPVKNKCGRFNFMSKRRRILSVYQPNIAVRHAAYERIFGTQYGGQVTMGRTHHDTDKRRKQLDSV